MKENVWTSDLMIAAPNPCAGLGPRAHIKQAVSDVAEVIDGYRDWSRQHRTAALSIRFIGIAGTMALLGQATDAAPSAHAQDYLLCGPQDACTPDNGVITGFCTNEYGNLQTSCLDASELQVQPTPVLPSSHFNSCGPEYFTSLGQEACASGRQLNGLCEQSPGILTNLTAVTDEQNFGVGVPKEDRTLGFPHPDGQWSPPFVGACSDALPTPVVLGESGVPTPAVTYPNSYEPPPSVMSRIKPVAVKTGGGAAIVVCAYLGLKALTNRARDKVDEAFEDRWVRNMNKKHIKNAGGQPSASSRQTPPETWKDAGKEECRFQISQVTYFGRNHEGEIVDAITVSTTGREPNAKDLQNEINRHQRLLLENEVGKILRANPNMGRRDAYGQAKKNISNRLRRVEYRQE